MDFFNSAKKKLMESVGISDRAAPDSHLDLLSRRIQQLDDLVLSLRKNIHRYSTSVLEVSQNSCFVSNDISEFYQKSPSRAKSVQKFSQVSFKIDSIAIETFRDSFHRDVLVLFDRWSRKLSDIQRDIQEADNLHQELHLKREKFFHLNPMHPDKHVSEQLEGDIKFLENKLGLMKKELDGSVSEVIETRFGVFDFILVRFMECQAEFYRASAEAMKPLDGNVVNFRKRYPLGSVPKYLDDDSLDKVKGVGNSNSNSNSKRDIVRSYSEDEEEEEEEEEYEEEEEEEESEVEVEEETVQDQSFDIMGAFNETSPSKPVPIKTDNVFSVEDLFATSAPPTTTHAAFTHDLFDPSPDFSEKKTEKAHPKHSSIESFDPFYTQTQTKTKSKVKATKTKTKSKTKPKSNSWSENRLSSAAVPKKKRSDASSVTSGNVKAVIAKNQREKLDFYQNSVKQTEKNNQDKRLARHNLEQKLDDWELKKGVRRNLRSLLSSLHTILWEGHTFKPVDLAMLMNPAHVKKAYFKALVVVHPDKIKDPTPEKQVIAERLFFVLNEEWDKFRGI